MKCEFCGREEALPFVCNYCGGAYCGEHRLPEAHQCKGDLTLKRTVTAPPQTTFSWQTPAGSETGLTPKKSGIFSRTEIRDIAIAWLTLGAAFALASVSRVSLFGGAGLDLRVFPGYFAMALVTVGPGFVFHELSHKFVARRYGFWAEFRMFPTLLLLALVTSLFGIIFAAPGATFISGASISQEENGKISIAGPAVNVVVALLFLPLALFGTGFLAVLGSFGAYINIFLAVFNLIPFGPLDGSKVFRWNKLIWASSFVPLALILYFVFFA